jgi:hypothetical protein
MRLLAKVPGPAFSRHATSRGAWRRRRTPPRGPHPTRLPPAIGGTRKYRWARFGVPFAIAAAVALAGGLAGQYPWKAPAGALTRFTWTLPAGTSLDSAPAVAPDGRSIAFTALMPRPAALRARSAVVSMQGDRGNRGATLPFWSPDGQSLALLHRRQVDEGIAAEWRTRRSDAKSPVGRGGAWSASGSIIFAPDLILSGLSRVPAEGGNASRSRCLMSHVARRRIGGPLHCRMGSLSLLRPIGR